MKVLIISANTLPATPTGPAYVAGAVKQAGHEVAIFDCYLSENPIENLIVKIKDFHPDVIGLSIREVTGDIQNPSVEFKTSFFDNRPQIKKMVNQIKLISTAKIVLGGPGFNYFAREWLDYLNLDYGIRGEGEVPFPMFLDRLEQEGDLESIPGCISRKGNVFITQPRYLNNQLDANTLPAYELFDMKQYQEKQISCGIYTKRGCPFNCVFCPHSNLEHKRYRMKSPKKVVDEIEWVKQQTGTKKFNFCDNSFNVPKKHSEAICQELIDRKMDIQWQTGSLKPIGITDELLSLYQSAGAYYISLAVESCSEEMLENMHRGYKIKQVEKTFQTFIKSEIPFGISILIGGPGETRDTIKETFSLLDRYPEIDDIWVSVGLCLWTGYQDIVKTLNQSENQTTSGNLFSGAYYISPELEKQFMIEFIQSLEERKAIEYQINIPFSDYSKNDR
jgi:hypothetical protein